jgi:hypothetical protein
MARPQIDHCFPGTVRRGHRESEEQPLTGRDVAIERLSPKQASGGTAINPDRKGDIHAQLG